jgi:hypothetical protein
MAFPGSIYAPPGVYTQTKFEDPVRGLAAGLRIPMIVGTGSEILAQDGLELVRGSSSTVDQRVVQEDEAGRAVVSISDAGAVTRGSFDGERNRVQVKHFPIVTGNGTGTTATDAATVLVTIDGTPSVVLAIDGAKGILTLSSAPPTGADVRVTYYFNRTDTLITDTLSDQASPDGPEVYGEVGQNFEIVESVNDTLVFTVDSEDAVEVTISESPSGGWTAAQIAAFINSAATGTSLVASTAINSFGDTVLYLVADRDIAVGEGSANTTLGLTAGSDTARNKVFYVFQRPIVDGSNAGVATTDPADVTVKVDGTQVIPSAVDGQSGAITLPFAPEVGAVITATYYFNSWQDTFDYLAHRGIQNITQCGITPDRNDYVDGADFVLQDDKILWGTAVAVEAGEATSGGTVFDGTQVAASLVDTRQYLASCAPVVNTSVNPPVENRLDFTLPLQPTTGNGRDTPLSSDTYSAVSNGRIDLPTNRPDLVFAYWGYSVADALDRGRVEVTKVESATNTITLAEPVPADAQVYATFYYNTLVDQTYSVACVTAGASGVGTYSISNESGAALLTPQFDSKGTSLATVTVNFPSGSERRPDVRFEAPFDSTSFTGAVEEDVTIQFESRDATPAKYAVPGSGPYYTVSGASDHFDLEVDAVALGAGFVDLSDVNGAGCGFAAQHTGDEVVYDPDNGYTDYAIDSTNNSIDLQVDGVLIQAEANSGTTTAEEYVTAINDAAWGDWDTVSGAGAVDGSTIALAAPGLASSSDVEDYYVGWTVEIITAGGVAPEGETSTVAAYDATTGIATVSPVFSAQVPGGATYRVYNADACPLMRGTTRFLASTTIALNEFDQLSFSYNGDTTAQATTTITLTPGAYPTATDLVTEINAQITAAALGYGLVCGVDTSGRLTFTLTCAAADDADGGYVEFVSNGTAARDFATLAGLSHAGTADAAQAKMIHGPIARYHTDGGGAATGGLLYDRIILRNRIYPGSGSVDGQSTLDQCQLEILGGTGASQAGLVAEETALAGLRGTIMEPTLFGEIGLSGGQSAAGEPLVTFYQSGGTTPQNNVFSFTFEGTPVSFEFTDSLGNPIASGASADVPLGPAGTTNTILNQIAAAMSAAGIAASAGAVLTAGLIVQEGAGIRFRGASSRSSASIVIGGGSANSALGFSSGDTAFRSALSAKALVSALMGHAQAAIADTILSWEGAATYFAAEAIAKTVYDDAGARYLFLQSQSAGSSSSIAFTDAAVDSVTLPSTGLGVQAGDGNVGEAAIEGYFVTSSVAGGSGSADTSLLNAGTGQDGIVGQTYRDAVTGLTFTVLERDGGSAYPTGANATVTFKVRASVTSDSNLPVNTIPGVELTVSNTTGVVVGDTADVNTYEKGGSQPAVGDVYYVSYQYRKQDYSPQLYTKMSAVEATYGEKSPNFPVSLAAYFGFVNGAVLIGIKQVQKDTDTDADGIQDAASDDAWLAAIDDIEGKLPGGLSLDVICPLKGDSVTLFEYIAKHCDLQSSIRYQAERTAVCGFSAGTEPRAAGETAQAIARTRMRFVYPDIGTLTLSRADGTNDSYLVDGTYFAAAMVGASVSPTLDVATPWTGIRLFGFDQIGRVLDAVQQNQVAVKGITVLEDVPPVIRVRQGLTSDMSNVLTKTPTVILIADEVQRQARATLNRFIGTKFLPGVTSDIELQMSTTLRQLQEANIIAAYTGVSAAVDTEDPTVANVEAYYQPVFPLLYIVCTFNVRSSL